MKNKVFRHGDISFKRVDKIPTDLKEIKILGNSWVVAEGETTGHKHLLTAERMVIKQANDGRFYLSLDSDGVITHEEHKTITIPVGDYVVINEREKDWFQGAVKRVVD